MLFSKGTSELVEKTSSRKNNSFIVQSALSAKDTYDGRRMVITLHDKELESHLINYFRHNKSVYDHFGSYFEFYPRAKREKLQCNIDITDHIIDVLPGEFAITNLNDVNQEVSIALNSRNDLGIILVNKHTLAVANISQRREHAVETLLSHLSVDDANYFTLYHTTLKTIHQENELSKRCSQFIGDQALMPNCCNYDLGMHAFKTFTNRQIDGSRWNRINYKFQHGISRILPVYIAQAKEGSKANSETGIQYPSQHF